MRRAPALLLLLAGVLPPSAAAELYRCEGEAGPPRFVDNASACPGAEPFEPSREIQRGSAPSADARGQTGATPVGRLEELFPAAERAGGSGHWEIVTEAAGDAAADPDLVSWGVKERRVRHYTQRESSGRVRVCSVELWSFESEERARAAEAGISYPNWRFERVGALLVMLHGVSRERGERARYGVFAECARLGGLVSSRAGGRSP